MRNKRARGGKECCALYEKAHIIFHVIKINSCFFFSHKKQEQQHYKIMNKLNNKPLPIKQHPQQEQQQRQKEQQQQPNIQEYEPDTTRFLFRSPSENNVSLPLSPLPPEMKGILTQEEYIRLIEKSEEIINRKDIEKLISFSILAIILAFLVVYLTIISILILQESENILAGLVAFVGSGVVVVVMSATKQVCFAVVDWISMRRLCNHFQDCRTSWSSKRFF